MKKCRLLVVCLAILFASMAMISCGITSNMTDQEAYDFGYGIGKTLRTVIDN